LTIAQGATFYINSTDTAWLKISSKDTISYSNGNGNAVYGIQVFGSLKIDSVKITSWNSETNDYSTSMTNESKSTSGPFIIVQKGASGTTDITNSEIAYLEWLSYFGGNGSVLRGDNIHHLSFGFYSKGVSDMILEGNNVHDNGIYGIDPHTGTHDMIIRNNDVHNDGSIDIICSLNCYNIKIEGNHVYNKNNSSRITGAQFPIGIMFSRNTSNSIARNNFVENESKGISITTGSHNNEINNNTISNSGRGIYENHGSSQNTIHGNTIINPNIFGLDVDTGAFGNVFYSNISRNNNNSEGQRYVFLYYTESGGGNDGDDIIQKIPPLGNRLYRYELINNELVNPVLFLDLPAIPGTSNRAEHNGGKVIIGPDEDDDNVYVGIGEVGGRRTQAENVVGGPSPDGTGGY
jgi:mannuronan 5-epimerase